MWRQQSAQFSAHFCLLFHERRGFFFFFLLARWDPRKEPRETQEQRVNHPQLAARGGRVTTLGRFTGCTCATQRGPGVCSRICPRTPSYVQVTFISGANGVRGETSSKVRYWVRAVSIQFVQTFQDLCRCVQTNECGTNICECKRSKCSSKCKIKLYNKVSM